MAREFAKEFYASSAWRKTRKMIISARGGLCEKCLSKGLINAGTVVHHRTELTPENITNPSIALGTDNLVLLCRECHEKIHSRMGNGRYEFDEKGRIAPLGTQKNLRTQ